jgi:K(+)-stimulated pyrophosphate-energized sodium pump
MLGYYSLVIICGVIALLYGAIVISAILKSSPGNERMQEIARAIQEGARAYLNRQYRMVAIVGIIVAALLTLLLGWHVGLGFIIGAVLSGAAGYIGMNVSVRANVRTTEAARSSLEKALSVAFNSGAVTGILVVGLAILGITVYYFFMRQAGVEMRTVLEALVALSFGASLISIFARLGGGIFTKGADVGADLVGKIEAGIPEDDPRNPAVIADNVGDNVGDCAGMAADVFETYVVTIVGCMLLAAISFQGFAEEMMMMFPLAIGAACIIGSIVGTFFVRLGKKKCVMGALYKGVFVTGIVSGLLILWLVGTLIGFDTEFVSDTGVFTGTSLFWCALLGLVFTGVIMWITEYYTMTTHRPVKSIARSSLTGHGGNIIQGLAVSMEATVLPVIFIAIVLAFSYSLAGLYGIGVTVTTMLGIAGMVVALDAYGPVTDNAGGIAEMADLPEEVRKRTDTLDAVGNTTKAVTKGYAIASAGLAALVLFAAFTEDLSYYFSHHKIMFALQDPYVIVGLLIGGLLPYLFGSISMMAVSRSASGVVDEVRSQFKDNPGIMEGTSKPNYGRTVDYLTKAAIKEMVIPSLLPVLAPVILYFVITLFAGQAEAFVALGAMLLGVVITGLFLALSMTSGGGAWDNAKKLIEDGEHGGKGSEAHKAAITGDTVGDPYKDTSGPAINPMIKIANIVAILLLAILSQVG